MQTAPSNLLARDDTMLGVCEALGEDFGFNPNLLRIALAAGLLWDPLAMIGLYLALGVVVLVSRLLAPNPRRAETPASAVEMPAEVAPAASAAAPVAPELAAAA